MSPANLLPDIHDLFPPDLGFALGKGTIFGRLLPINAGAKRSQIRSSLSRNQALARRYPS
jgi:hypothetical protein